MTAVPVIPARTAPVLPVLPALLGVDIAEVPRVARAVADHGDTYVRHVLTPAGWQAPEGDVETITATGPEPLQRELELFLDAVARRQTPVVDADAGLLALRTVEAARRSSDLGRRVTLEEIG